MRFDGVIMDWDECVLRTDNSVHRYTWRASIEKIIERKLTEEEWSLIEKQAFGMPEPDAASMMSAFIRRLTKRELAKETVIETRREFLRDFCPKDCVLEPFILEICKFCRDNGIKLGICSSSCRYFLDWALRHTALDQFVDPDHIISADNMVGSGDFKDSKVPWALAMFAMKVYHTTKPKMVLEDNLANAITAHIAHPGAIGYVVARSEEMELRLNYELNKKRIQPGVIKIVRTFEPAFEALTEGMVIAA